MSNFSPFEYPNPRIYLGHYAFLNFVGHLSSLVNRGIHYSGYFKSKNSNSTLQDKHDEHGLHGSSDQHDFDDGNNNQHIHATDENEEDDYMNIANEIHDDHVYPFNISDHIHHDHHHHIHLQRDDPNHPQNQPLGTLAKAICQVEPSTNRPIGSPAISGNITIYQRVDFKGPVYFDLELQGFEGVCVFIIKVIFRYLCKILTHIIVH